MSDPRPTNLLILDAMGSEACDREIAVVDSVAKSFRPELVTYRVSIASIADLPKISEYGVSYDYVYLCTHATPEGFGDRDENFAIQWPQLSEHLCLVLPETGATAFLGCCLGGFDSIAADLFEGCALFDSIIGPRYSVDPDDLIAAFHTVIYNLVCRREDPPVAAKRASKATGKAFECHDKWEFSHGDRYWTYRQSYCDRYPVYCITEPGESAPSGV